MPVSVVCEGCGKLVTDENVSRTTLKHPEFVFCALCDDLAPTFLIRRHFPSILGKLRESRRVDNVNSALGLLTHRLIQSMDCILLLRKSFGAAKASVDVETILRSMYDASLQAEYIASNRGSAPVKAQDYMDFTYVERHEAVKCLDRYHNAFASSVANSPRRSAGEPVLNKEFARVESRFRSAKGKLRDKWHDQSLRSFSKNQKREEEYDFIIKSLHGSTHSSFAALKSGGKVAVALQPLLAANLCLRALAVAMEYNGIPFGDLVAALVELARANLITSFESHGCAGNVAGPKTNVTTS